MNLKDYINEFECLYNKIKVFNMELPDGVLAYCVLKCSNLSPENKKKMPELLSKSTFVKICVNN